MRSDQLPRLLYVGDQPVESTVGGPALLYRLLQDYPTDLLRILQGNLERSDPQRRLPGIDYEILKLGISRMMYTRFRPLYAAWLFKTSPLRIRRIAQVVDEFRPDAILAIAHGYMWPAVARVAQKRKLPLHLIVHDDVVRMATSPRWMRGTIERRLANVYRQATSRLCVSPYMAAHYQQAYGVVGNVVYPSRATDVPKFESPPDRSAANTTSDGLTFAFAGSLHWGGYMGNLGPLADVLGVRGHKLELFCGVMSSDQVKRHGLDGSHVRFHAMIPFKELIHRLRAECDVLVVPMSFDPNMRTDVEICFPSKLTDYTATGLPLLVWGPPYCAATRWANDNPGIAEVVDTPEPQALSAAVERLAASAAKRRDMGLRAMQIGQQYFSHDAVVQHFHRALTARGGDWN